MLSRLSVKRPYTVLVGVVLVLVLGFVSLTEMTTDLLPSMNLPYAIVMTTYVGASPEEVELSVTKPIEASMATISNIDTISSISSENYSLVILEFNQTANMDSATIEMRESLDQIAAGWSSSVGSPIIMKLNPDMLPIMVAAVGGSDMTNAEVTNMVQNTIIPEIESLEGVASVSSTGDIEENVQIVIYEDKIEEANLRVVRALDDKFDEAEEELQEAKDEIKDGLDKVNSGKNELANQAGGADAQLSDAKGEILKAQIQIDSQLQTLETTETVLLELQKQLINIQSRVNELEQTEDMIRHASGMKSILEQLDGAQAQVDAAQAQVDMMPESSDAEKAAKQAAQAQVDESRAQVQAQYDALESQLNNQGMTTSQLRQTIAGLDANLSGLGLSVEEVSSALAELDSTLASLGYTRETLPQALSDIQNQLNQIAQGKTLLNNAKSQIADGTVGVNDAMTELGKSKILASIELASASAQLGIAESAIESAEEDFDDAKESAYKNASLGNIISTDLIVGLLTAQNFAMPAGYVTEDGIEYLVRVGNKFDDVDELNDMVLMDMGLDGLDPILLSDVADVVMTDNTDEVYAKVNGQNGIMLTIQKQTEYSTGEVSDLINAKFDQLLEENEDLEIIGLMDQGVYIDMVVSSVFSNLISGGILAVIILIFFLKDIKPTIVIAFSIPISLIAAIALMYFSGVTLNIISLSGLALGVGMLVDNSIVVIENIYRLRNEGVPVRRAAVEGAREVAGAIFASTLTTISVFFPIVFTEGITRQLFVDMALTLGYSLLMSLFVALTLVPAMSASLLKRTSEKQNKLFDKIQVLYGRVVKVVLNHKIVVLIVTVALFAVTMWGSLAKGTAFMPAMESTQISVSVSLEEGATLNDTAEVSDEVMDRLMAIDGVDSIGAMTGGSGIMSSMGGGGSDTEVSMYVLLSDDNKQSSDEIAELMLEKTADLDCEVSVNTQMMDMSALGGSGISVRIKGNNIDTLQQVAEEVAVLVDRAEGTENVDNGIEETTGELRIVVDKAKAMEYQLTVAQVYAAIAGKIADASSATTITTDIEDYEVFVVDNEDEALVREDIKKLEITGTDEEGEDVDVPLKEIVEFQDTNTLASIGRSAQSRYLDVSAEIADGYNVGLVSSDVEALLADYEVPAGFTVEMVGEDQTINEAMTELMKMLGLAVVFIYLIMVAQFQSLQSPFIIMFTLPLAFTGGFLGLILTNNELSIIAMIGFVMLAGIIVNNGIVLVDYINQLRKRGLGKREAIIQAGETRLRPILMTALTTILGLSTMAMGIGMGSDMMQPMAIVTIGGLVYGTFLTLLVIPCIYDIFFRKEEMKEIDLDEDLDLMQEGE